MPPCTLRSRRVAWLRCPLGLDVPRYEPTGPSIAVVVVPADGEYTLGVRAADAAGNVGALSDSASFLVDTVPPHTSALLPWWDLAASGAASPDALPSTSDRQVAVNASALEPDGSECELCTFTCVLGAEGVHESLALGEVNCTVVQPSTPANTTLLVPLSIDGLYTLHVVAVDGAGNADPTPPVLQWTADVTAPNTTAAVVDGWAKDVSVGDTAAATVNASTVELVVGCSDGWELCGFQVYVYASGETWPAAATVSNLWSHVVTGGEAHAGATHAGSGGTGFVGRLTTLSELNDATYVQWPLYVLRSLEPFVSACGAHFIVRACSAIAATR